MRIGFDAKRAFANRSGLGNYSRFILDTLASHLLNHELFLFTPTKHFELYNPKEYKNIHTIQPKGVNKLFKAYWRSQRAVKDIEKLGIDIYHGLSGEIPYDMHKTSVKSVVTIHDLIFLRYPELYKRIDRNIYTSKAKYACEKANKIIAISKQTKSDIIEFLGTPEEKISVVYQGCNPVFYQNAPESAIQTVLSKYKIPIQYILYVGTIEERKNLLTIVEAIHKHKIDMPLVIVGKETSYANRVKKYIAENKVKGIHFLQNVLNDELPVLFQQASVFVYPSVFEGFGIPVLEALWSKTPVITNKEGCFTEAGGPESIYVDIKNHDEIAASITKVISDKEYSRKIAMKGFEYAQKFKPENIASELKSIYISL
ncbi:MAG: glycosyltransferase family 4 protein [Bacteroidales bacterium]|nr:glycosyltransferase family 4 protein [Bacteroidales bacterium]